MCPTRFRTNNRILPANARAADVAERAVQEIVPVQQRRYYSAFRVQGIECVAYNYLTQGRRCSCHSRSKQLQGLLDKDGKASTGTINQLITGNMSFNVTPYDQGLDLDPQGTSSPYAPVNKNQGVFDIVTPQNEEFPFADQVPDGEYAEGDNGPLQGIDLDDLLGDVDVTAYGMSDVTCPICFGSGFVGGFSVFHSYRHVMTVTDVEVVNGVLDTLEKPFVCRSATGFAQKIVLPRGAIQVESFKVYNGYKVVPTQWTVDQAPVMSHQALLAKCDGRPHLVQATFSGPSDFTHLEIQFTMSTESLYFEFPRRPSGADTSLLEQMEPFQIVMSPNIPQLASRDVIVESQLGKVLIVQNVNPWQSRQLNVLGPECQVRVIQPQEAFRILPSRPRVPQQQPSTKMIRDNVNGVFRT